jgi:hypothetical protein
MLTIYYDFCTVRQIDLFSLHIPDFFDKSILRMYNELWFVLKFYCGTIAVSPKQGRIKTYSGPGLLLTCGPLPSPYGER